MRPSCIHIYTDMKILKIKELICIVDLYKRLSLRQENIPSFNITGLPNNSTLKLIYSGNAYPNEMRVITDSNENCVSLSSI